MLHKRKRLEAVTAFIRCRVGGNRYTRFERLLWKVKNTYSIIDCFIQINILYTVSFVWLLFEDDGHLKRSCWRRFLKFLSALWHISRGIAAFPPEFASSAFTKCVANLWTLSHSDISQEEVTNAQISRACGPLDTAPSIDKMCRELLS